jgi:anti-sigma factor RsiW
MSVHLNQEQVDAYLDGELPADGRKSAEEHVASCDECRKAVERRRALLEFVRSGRPNAQAPASLRQKVNALWEADRDVQGKPGIAARAARSGWPRLFNLHWTALGYAAAFFLLMVTLSFWLLSRREMRAASFVEMAVQTHRRGVQGSLPVQLQTNSAREATQWLAARLPFQFRLPTYQEDSGDRSRYEMIGASITSFRGRETAYVAYRMKNALISLVVTSADRAVAVGGDLIVAKSLVFHSIKKGELEVVTWSVHDLTYALVSDVTLPPRQSCVVCHSDPKDRKWQQAYAEQRPREQRTGFKLVSPINADRFLLSNLVTRD